MRVKDAVKSETERVFDPHGHRRKVWLLTIPFVLLNGVLMCVTIMPFVQWCVTSPARASLQPLGVLRCAAEVVASRR